MLRILHVIRSLGSGGAERQIVDLVKNTQGPEFSHTVCHLMGPDLFGESIRESGGEVICLGVKGKRPWLSASRALRTLVRRRQPDLIHTWLLDATMAARLAELGGIKCPRIVSLCGPDYEPDVIRAANWPPAKIALLRWIDELSGRLFTETYVACSNYIRESGKRRLHIPESRILTIYNSVDPESLRNERQSPSELRQELGISDDAVLFINVGRLDPQKGQTFLLRALKQIEPQVPLAHVALVGEGGMEGALRNLVSELRLEKRVSFLGVRTDIGRCLKASDVFVFPSIFEGFGMALIEAMFLGLPTISFMVGPIPEIVERPEMGRLIPPGDVDELARHMLELYRDPKLRQRIGEEGRESALRRFSSLQSIIPQWRALYAKLALPREHGA